MKNPTYATRQLIEDLKKNVFCRLKTSPIHGVGVFAVRDIPRSINLFRGFRTKDDTWVKVPQEKVFSNTDIPDPVKEMVEDLYIVKDGQVWFPQMSLNEIGVAYFVNHSSEPNLRFDHTDSEFYTLRPIKAGEELTVDYQTYNDEIF